MPSVFTAFLTTAATTAGLLAAPALLAQTLPAASAPCTTPFGLTDNAERVFTLQDARGRTTGFVRQRVVSLGTEQNKKQTITTNTLLLKSGIYDAKNQLLSLRDLTFRCRQDTAFTDGTDQLSPDQLERFQDRLLTYSPTPLAWPNQPTVGSELPAGGMLVDVRSSAVAIAQVYARVGQRRVTGQEQITTPAGTFACFKVESERETGTQASRDIKLTSTLRIVDYYAPSVGLVRSEYYDKRGRLTQVRLLTSLQKTDEVPDKVKYKTKKA